MNADFFIDPGLASIIIFCVIFQSIFGVGVLLLGTPLFLLNNVAYEAALEILLPVSISISITQFITNRHRLKTDQLIKFATLCLPALFCGLYIILIFEMDPTLFVVSALIFAGVIRLEKLDKRNTRSRSLEIIWFH